MSTATITVGSEVWERQDALADYEPRGGVVLSIAAPPDPDDPETHSAYLVLNPHKIGRQGVKATLCTLSDLGAEVRDPDPFRLSSVVRFLCAEVAFTSPGRARRGLLTPGHAEWVAWAHRLTGTVMGGSR